MDEYTEEGAQIAKERTEIDKALHNHINAGGDGFYIMIAARLIISELRLMTRDIRREMRRPVERAPEDIITQRIGE